MSAASTRLSAGLALVFLLLLMNQRLWHTDLWDHINYGRFILETRSLPTEEPLLPLAAGMPLVNTAWGSQVLMALTADTLGLGLPALQFGHGLLVITSIGAVGWAVTKHCGSAVFGLLGSLLMLWVNWQQFLVIRPQLAGVACFSVLTVVLFSNRVFRPGYCISMLFMFMVWSNLHGSFAMGLTLIAVTVAGAGIAVLTRTGSVGGVLRSRRVRRLTVLCLLCGLAALVNPNGLLVYREVLRVGGNPNVATMYEWKPLSLSMKQGQAAATACLLLLVVLPFSPRRFRPEEGLVLLVFGGLAIWSSRMINWFAPVASLIWAIHAAAVWQKAPRDSRLPGPRADSRTYTVANLAICLCCFAFSNFGAAVMRGQATPPERILSRQTPISTAAFLRSENQLPPGLAFVPAEWSGYFTYCLRSQIKPMVNLHVHVIPGAVWRDYLRLARGTGDWQRLLHVYQINAVIADRFRNSVLIGKIRTAPAFRLLYEDRQATVFVRRQPLGMASAASPDGPRAEALFTAAEKPLEKVAKIAHNTSDSVLFSVADFLSTPVSEFTSEAGENGH